jgi:uncharacterized protein YndB with AHSA1/START domain
LQGSVAARSDSSHLALRMSTSAIAVTLELPVKPEQAFETFTEGFGSWWPAEYTWSGESLKAIGIEPHEGGRCTEVGPHGFQCDFGRVLIWNPPSELRMTWQISPRREPEPELASELSIRFERSDTGCTMHFLHEYIERHGDGAQDYRAGLASEQGWPYILGLFSEACSLTQ